ncbi:MAG: hypothetical protein ACP5HJ_02255 [Candidatus Micrarchaeia archaeon]
MKEEVKRNQNLEPLIGIILGMKKLPEKEIKEIEQKIKKGVEEAQEAVVDDLEKDMRDLRTLSRSKEVKEDEDVRKIFGRKMLEAVEEEFNRRMAEFEREKKKYEKIGVKSFAKYFEILLIAGDAYARGSTPEKSKIDELIEEAKEEISNEIYKTILHLWALADKNKGKLEEGDELREDILDLKLIEVFYKDRSKMSYMCAKVPLDALKLYYEKVLNLNLDEVFEKSKFTLRK